MCLRLSDVLTQLENCLLFSFYYSHCTILLKFAYNTSSRKEMRYHSCKLFVSPVLVVNERYSWIIMQLIPPCIFLGEDDW